MLKTLFKKNIKYIYMILLPIYIALTVILVVLNLFSVIDYSWIVGFIAAAAFGFASFLLLYVSSKKLAQNQNPHLYVFFSILRLGLYMVPLLISIYLPNYVSSFGVLIGFLISLIFPMILKN
ncbi:hypothetical protein SHELI_v1c00610 [Spiroplasma helicoides]|uniref:Uncharacterized protein n=1 Tax=Spiroplasma helicoides TaxID=216938 RepID=A0A1B3SJA6_9MOLU|nr:MG406 family protein [Spiroplasma helicoides]AOG60016.1 hypothetical protein SHELI_v1c00610 [Spiroplasma helicoides]